MNATSRGPVHRRGRADRGGSIHCDREGILGRHELEYPSHFIVPVVK
jgi:hypothetical protein